MKRTLILLAALLLAVPALYAAGAPAAATAPASTLETPTAPPPPDLPDTTPAPFFRTACSISKDCACGDGFVTISCSGTVSCTSTAFSITCDGRRYSCTMVDCNPQGGGGAL
jgi:hypothetical protein